MKGKEKRALKVERGDEDIKQIIYNASKVENLNFMVVYFHDRTYI